MEFNLKIRIPNICDCELNCYCKQYIKCKNNCLCGNLNPITQFRSIYAPKTPDYRILKNIKIKKRVKFGETKINIVHLILKSNIYYWTIDRNKKIKNNFLSPQPYTEKILLKL